MMSTVNTTVIHQQCVLLLDQSGNSIKSDQLNAFFDIITAELTKCTPLTKDFDLITKIVTTLIAIDKKQLSKQSQLVAHQLLIILRDYLIKLLFNQEQSDLVTKLSILFDNICYAGVSTDEIIILIIYKPLIDEICVFFHEIEKHFEETKLIEVINRLLQLVQRIQMTRLDVQQNPIIELLFGSIAKCIGSKCFLETLRHVPKHMLDLNAIQTLLFDTCIEFMYWQPYEDNSLRRENLVSICKKLLHTTVDLMSSLSLSEPMTRLGCLLSLSVMVVDDTLDDKIIDKNYYKLIDHCISMLDHDGSMMTKRTLLATLCHLTYDIDMVVYMKNNLCLKSLLQKMSESDDSEISFNAYRILGVIMTEEDIKTLANASKLVGVFYLYFISMLDDPIQKTAFYSLLHSLKSLVQHDQIKIELFEQGVIPLLIRCVIETSFHTTKARQCALEILLALSFNNDIMNVLKQDTSFMTYLKTVRNSTEEGIRRAANHLLWQSEQKINPIAVTASISSSSASSKFDIMISYSHSDKTTCFQIYENLIKDGFHVWLDRDQMHGDTMTAMANAIENSEFVVICMSDAYKQSPYCQAEGHYAFERRCKLIPLVMKAKYKPDGWLGIIISGKIYVDFSKFQFDVAYSLLKTEIQKKRNTAPVTKKTITAAHQLPLKQPPSPLIVDQHQPVMDLPHSIDAWSADHVRSFLTANNFTSLLPVFTDFNGRLLHQAYSMCQTNRETMFQSMRSEVIVAENVSLLTLGTYLRFLEELKKYVPVNSGNKLQEPTSIICNIM